MGCENEKEETEFNIATEFRQAGLVPPASGLCQNDLETQIFMAINVLRWEPVKFSNIVAKTQKKWAGSLTKEP